MSTKHGILRDLRLRLNNMSDVEEGIGTCESARKVRQMIRVLQKTNSIESVDPVILDLSIRKSCSQSQRIDFESYFHKGFNKSDKKQEYATLDNHEAISSLSIPMQIVIKLQFLHGYLDDYIQSQFVNYKIGNSANKKPRKKSIETQSSN